VSSGRAQGPATAATRKPRLSADRDPTSSRRSLNDPPHRGRPPKTLGHYCGQLAWAFPDREALRTPLNAQCRGQPVAVLDGPAILRLEFSKVTRRSQLRVPAAAAVTTSSFRAITLPPHHKSWPNRSLQSSRAAWRIRLWSVHGRASARLGPGRSGCCSTQLQPPTGSDSFGRDAAGTSICSAPAVEDGFLKAQHYGRFVNPATSRARGADPIIAAILIVFPYVATPRLPLSFAATRGSRAEPGTLTASSAKFWRA